MRAACGRFCIWEPPSFQDLSLKREGTCIRENYVQFIKWPGSQEKGRESALGPQWQETFLVFTRGREMGRQGFYFFMFIFVKFIFERECKQGRGRERKREKASQVGSVLSAQSRLWGSDLRTEITT